MRFGRFVSRLLGLVAAVALIGCGSSSNAISGLQTVRGSGVMAQETRSVTGCDKVAIAVAADLRIEQGIPEAVRVEAEDNLLSYLDTDEIGSTLMIRTPNGVDLEPTLPIEFYLTIAELTDLTHAGVGSVDIVDVDGTRLALTLAGVGDIDVDDYDGQTLYATLSGVGDMDVSGTVVSQDITVAGVGDYDGRHLVSTHAEVTTSSVGSITVRVSGTLDVTILGSGSVYYIGNPVITRNITGTGTLQKIG